MPYEYDAYEAGAALSVWGPPRYLSDCADWADMHEELMLLRLSAQPLEVPF
jgi:hypothetical protein